MFIISNFSGIINFWKCYKIYTLGNEVEKALEKVKKKLTKSGELIDEYSLEAMGNDVETYRQLSESFKTVYFMRNKKAFCG